MIYITRLSGSLFVVCLPTVPVKCHEGTGIFFWFVFADLLQTPSTLPGTYYMFNKYVLNK